ncbi:3-isopropylmalate/(R)-2-methylmalate dehydratase small subunit [Erythrobacter litoralis]|uniref:3-isopropylmalate dehydratase n=1 Tax=Erythrobacter litoralis TaxID=39960 RepID=A0A074MTC6_9SPHN|nr:3-isopropylmalate dehydratase small subunit [Erythrobacter litoralis]AOL24766.1 3-isopropylmalate/(R)-2-methylmalate dehydratase small subunit [Erythrobacter litoralis]KEO96744.1 3-isopropylmalate dehydratase [Erythrobacter litoralis]
MTAFPQPLTGIAAPLHLDRLADNPNHVGGLADNVDTDAVIPSREMRSTGRTGLADGLFAPWRYSDADARTPDPDFVLNRPEYCNATILVAGSNFGCGSSREHAVWALAEYGFRAVLAESFAPIFRGNCIRNFVLPVALPREVLESIAGQVVEIDLAAQEVRCRGEVHPFEIDPEAKRMLADGLDAIDLTLTQGAAIDAWTGADRKARPWVYLERTQ